MADTTGAGHAAAIRQVTAGHRAGQGMRAALGVLLAHPAVDTAEHVTPAPAGPAGPGRISVPLAAGGALLVRTRAQPAPDLPDLVDTVAATLDALGASPDFRDALIAQMPTIVVLFDPAGRLRWSNLDTWPDGSPVRPGVPGAEAVSALVHPRDRAGLTRTLGTLHSTDPGGRARHTVRVRAGAGDWLVMDVIVKDHVDDPPLNGVLAFGRDITALHETEYDLAVTAARLRTLVSALRAGVLLQDADRTVLVANDAMVDLLGLGVSPAELAGKGGDDVIGLRTLPADAYRELDEFAARCMAGSVPVLGTRVGLGPDRTMEVDFVPVRTARRRHGQLWVIHDVTQQEEVKRSLVARNEELSRLASLKTEFLATVSHELRTPLTALTGLTPLLTADFDGGQRALAEGVERNVARLATLVETLLLLARVESHSLPLDLARVPLDSVVRDQVAALAGARGAEVAIRLVPDPESGVRVVGDAALLARMLHHVLAMAVGSSDPGSEVGVVTSVDHAAGVWAVEVTDDCPLTVDTGRLFTTLPRTGAGTDPLVGSGLGLALARAVAERHGGAVFVSPSPSGGTTTRVELPLAGPGPR